MQYLPNSHTVYNFTPVSRVPGQYTQEKGESKPRQGSNQAGSGVRNGHKGPYKILGGHHRNVNRL